MKRKVKVKAAPRVAVAMMAVLLGLSGSGLSVAQTQTGRAENPKLVCKERAPSHVGARIIGGDSASIENWPGVVALRLSAPTGPTRPHYFCGGILLDPHWVVTARHCVRHDPEDHRIVAKNGTLVEDGGFWSLKNFRLEIVERTVELSGVGPENVLQTDRVILHAPESAEPKRGSDDIALIHLKTTARGRHMRVSVSRDADPEDSAWPLWAAGFGRTEDDNSDVPNFKTRDARIGWAGSHTLKEVDLAQYDDPQCAENQICAGARLEATHPKDTCNGDSGGPLALPGHDGCPILVGLVSYGPPYHHCGDPGVSAVYTRVSSYAKWIQENAPGIRLDAVSTSDPTVQVAAVTEMINTVRGLHPVQQGKGVHVALSPSGDVKVGDSREIHVTANGVSGYVIVLDIDAAGMITYLVPNAESPEPPFIESGKSLSFGSQNDSFQIQATPPLGQGHVVAIVAPDKSLAGRLNLATRSVQSRSLVVVKRSGVELQEMASTALHGNNKGQIWASGEASYTIVSH